MLKTLCIVNNNFIFTNDITEVLLIKAAVHWSQFLAQNVNKLKRCHFIWIKHYQTVIKSQGYGAFDFQKSYKKVFRKKIPANSFQEKNFCKKLIQEKKNKEESYY